MRRTESYNYEEQQDQSFNLKAGTRTSGLKVDIMESATRTSSTGLFLHIEGWKTFT